MRAQPHLDPLGPRIPDRDVLECVTVEVRAELGVEHGQHVLVEGGGHAGRVVVGGHQDSRVFHQVGAEQQGVPGAQPGPQPGQERHPLRGQQVADRAAQERDQARPVGRRQAQVLLKIRDHRRHGQARVAHQQPVGRRDER